MVALSGPASNLALAAERQESAHPQQAVETLLKAQAVPNLQPRTDFEATFPFSIRLANGRLRVAANDGTWYSDQPLAEGVMLDEHALLGFGSMGGGESTVTFRKLEWRAAEQPPR